jgi:hypothetical protein
MEQTGPLVSPAVLPKLSDAQLKRLQMAKKYCLDVSTKFVSVGGARHPLRGSSLFRGGRKSPIPLPYHSFPLSPFLPAPPGTIRTLLLCCSWL